MRCDCAPHHSLGRRAHGPAAPLAYGADAGRLPRSGRRALGSRMALTAVARRAHAILCNRRRLSWDIPLLPPMARPARMRLLLRVSDSYGRAAYGAEAGRVQRETAVSPSAERRARLAGPFRVRMGPFSWPPTRLRHAVAPPVPGPRLSAHGRGASRTLPRSCAKWSRRPRRTYRSED